MRRIFVKQCSGYAEKIHADFDSGDIYSYTMTTDGIVHSQSTYNVLHDGWKSVAAYLQANHYPQHQGNDLYEGMASSGYIEEPYQEVMDREKDLLLHRATEILKQRERAAADVKSTLDKELIDLCYYMARYGLRPSEALLKIMVLSQFPPVVSNAR